MDADTARYLPPVLAVLKARMECEPEGGVAGVEEYTDWGKSVVETLVSRYLMSAFLCAFFVFADFFDSVFLSQGTISKIAARANKTPQVLVPEFDEWCKHVSGILKPWKHSGWDEWCSPSLMPGLYEEEEHLDGEIEKEVEGEGMNEGEGHNSQDVDEAGVVDKRAAYLAERAIGRAAAIQALEDARDEALRSADAQKRDAASKAGNDFDLYMSSVSEIDKKIAEAEMVFRRKLKDIEAERKWDEGVSGFGEKEEIVEKAEKGDKEVGKGKKASGKAKVPLRTIVASNPVAQKRKAMDPSELQALQDAEFAEDVEEESEEVDDEDEGEVVNKDIQVRCLLYIICSFCLLIPFL
jgi:hypothetical protein